MARLLIGVSGGVAAYKALELARLATLAGHGVRVLMTPTAKRFVGPASFEAITGAPVLVDEFEPDPARGAFPGEPAPDHAPISHLALAQSADAYLVAPASANTLAKLATGACDSMVTTAFVAASCPRIVAPAMNDQMWADAATRANVETLESRGVTVIEPAVGELASRGERGAGRLPDPALLLAELERRAEAPAGGPWDGLTVLVTAGGTREPIDPVRFLGNRSSGRMGVAIAEAAVRRGARVELVAANVALETSAAVERADVETAAELAEATAERFERCDVLVMAAAVSDFTPERARAGKISRTAGEGGMSLSLMATEDVLASLAARRGPGQVLVGFAAEHGEGGLERARAKLARKGADAIVVNDVSRPGIGFDSDHNEVTIVSASAETTVERTTKHEVAESILTAVGELREQDAGARGRGARAAGGDPEAA